MFASRHHVSHVGTVYMVVHIVLRAYGSELCTLSYFICFAWNTHLSEPKIHTASIDEYFVNA